MTDQHNNQTGAAKSEPDARSMRTVAMTALGGTSIEWYDFFIYGTAAALVFPTLFFSDDMPRYVSLLASFSTFAVGFLARPVGGVVFGHFGDRVGRKAALVTALMMMGVATTLIGLLPSYEQIGPLAPVLLIFLRFVQGLAVGGQWGGAMLLVTENAPSNQRGFYGAFAQCGAPAGLVLANLAFLAVSGSLSDEAFMDWGWRVPFISSVLLIGLSLYVQLKLEDTEAFKELAEASQPTEAKPRSPVLKALTTYPREIALAAGSFLGVQVTFYICVAFIISYGTDPEGLNIARSDMLTAVLVSTMFAIPANFFFGAWSDRHGRRGVYKLGAILTGIWAFVMFAMIDTGNWYLITAGLSISHIFISMMYGPQAALLSELFSTEVRYSGASLGYQLGAILGGGFAPIIATTLLLIFGSSMWVAAYIALANVLTWFAIHALKETDNRDLDKVV
ncbi:MAG: MHS family MFS transporter [Pseudomonadales bacterium]|jgi:metabolite-proton symporter|nr:MFS transporter [Gammaproteobacteria bacterium]MCH1598394.1 MHS family MFS transporter [Pseudomonadales bacterium]RPG32964.1 MAG: MFS transporter [Gammaproteobacteria bacterium TMED243]